MQVGDEGFRNGYQLLCFNHGIDVQCFFIRDVKSNYLANQFFIKNTYNPPPLCSWVDFIAGQQNSWCHQRNLWYHSTIYKIKMAVKLLLNLKHHKREAIHSKFIKPQFPFVPYYNCRNTCYLQFIIMKMHIPSHVYQLSSYHLI